MISPGTAPPPHAPARTRPVVAIFRQNLFRVSEPFVTEQASRFRRYEPLYLGRFRFGDAPPDARSLALSDRGRLRTLPAIARQMATRAAGPFERTLGAVRPDLIHAHFGIDAVHALPLARRLRVPLLTTFHGYDATLSTWALLSSPAWANYPLFRRQLATEGALFLCVSRFIQGRVLARGFPPERTRVHHTGVDCDAIQVRTEAEETPMLLHVARLVEMKGTSYAIDAFAGLAEAHPTLRLVIVGDGPLRRRLVLRAKASGAGERIDFLGARPHVEVLALMRRAAILLLPSVDTASGRTEGLGMVLLEAAATGVPVIGSAVGGIPEGMIDGGSGLLVPPRNAEALTAAVAALLDDGSRRRRMGERGRRLVEERFDSRRLGRDLEAVYDDVLAETADVARARPRRRISA